MPRHVDAWMDGVRLADIGPVLIQGVTESSADMESTYTNRTGVYGRQVLVNKRRSLHVTIEIAIRELFDLAKRAKILQAVAGWASGSILELSNHRGQRLHVMLKSAPALGDVRDYTTVIPIEFEANVIPYWEEISPLTAQATTQDEEPAQLWIPGTADQVPVEVTFTRTSGTVTSLTVTVSCKGKQSQIQLSGMSVTQPIVFGRDANDRLTIKSGNNSLMRYRTQTSDDDLLIPCGDARVSVACNRSGSAMFSARGRWL